MSSQVLAVLTDKAFSQSLRHGCQYAIVPMPWMMDWADLVGESGMTEFDWASVCWWKGRTNHFNVQDCPMNDDGDYMVCLLPFEHEGRCGHEGINYHTPQPHALKVAAETDERLLRLV